MHGKDHYVSPIVIAMMVVGMDRHDFDVVLTFTDGDGDGGVVVSAGVEVRIDVLEVDLALGQEVAVHPREVLRGRQPR